MSESFFDKNSISVTPDNPIFSDLSKKGWDLSEDPELRALSLSIFSQFSGSEMQQLSQVASSSIVGSSDNWTSQSVSWEEPIQPSDRFAMRQDFLGSCLRSFVSPEFLADAKKRWEKGWFSSVTDKFLVLGDISVSRRGGSLPLLDESDPPLPAAVFGRDDVTYSVWKDLDYGRNITGCRMKINGDRFVHDPKQRKLFGFKTFDVPEGFVPSLCEYYAGVFYVLWPVMTSPFTISLKSGGLSHEFTFTPHSFVAPLAFLNKFPSPSHMYDGIILWDGKKEYRSKWNPTVEVLIEGTPWEVTCDASSLRPIRPRPGKKTIPVSNAFSRINSCLRALHLRPFLSCPVLDPSLVVDEIPNQQMGAKVMFVTRNRQAVFIREHGKRLDCLGGTCHYGEDHLDTICREVKEEVNISVDPSEFVYLGPSRAEGDSVVWISHVYLALAPDSILAHPNVESFFVSYWKEWKNSGQGRPRQVWLSRHLEFLERKFTSMDLTLMYLILLGKCPPTSHISLEVPDNIITEVAPVYSKIIQSLPDFSRFEFIRMSFTERRRFLTKRNLPYPPSMDSFLDKELIRLGVEAAKLEESLTTTVVKSVSSSVLVPISVPSSTASSSSALQWSSSAVFSSANSGGFVWPDPKNESACTTFFNSLFGSVTVLPAQDAYHRLHQMGFVGQRSTAIKRLDAYVLCGWFRFDPCVNGRGRLFVRLK
jgi:8-oxo-dGTP pyrophosphatase MutT (NUDIX family)